MGLVFVNRDHEDDEDIHPFAVSGFVVDGLFGGDEAASDLVH